MNETNNFCKRIIWNGREKEFLHGGMWSEQEQGLLHERKMKWTRITTSSWDEHKMNKNNNFCMRKTETNKNNNFCMEGRQNEQELQLLNRRMRIKIE